MLTPRFELSQDDDFLIIVIHAPYAKVAETEFHIQDENVCFYSKPYYLRLHLPGRMVDEDSRNEAKYDVDKGTFTARIAKENKGEVFEGLDMLTKLLTPPNACEKSTDHKPDLVEEITATPSSADPHVSPEESENQAEYSLILDEENDEDFDWYIEQTVPPETQGIICGGNKYGFALTISGLSEKLVAEFCEVVDVKDPDHVSNSEKRKQRLEHETQHFCGEHYLADLYDNDEISQILSFEPWWSKSCSDCKFSDEEKEKMLKLPKKRHLIDSEVLPTVYLSLVEIVFAYAYNHRVLYGEDNVESGWTIAKLSATLSWLDSFTSLQDVVVSCFRRALAYPLHRNWELCVKVWEDVQTLFSGGKKPLLKCLLDVHSQLIISDPHYIFDDLYITDYCVWIQSAKSKKIQSLASALKNITVTKSDVGFELEELEEAAALVVKERDGGIMEITDKLGGMGIDHSKQALDSDDDTDSGDGDDDESDEDSEEDESSDSEEEKEIESEEHTDSPKDNYGITVCQNDKNEGSGVTLTDSNSKEENGIMT